MASDKIKTVQEWPEPKKIKNVQAFLEFMSYASPPVRKTTSPR